MKNLYYPYNMSKLLTVKVLFQNIINFHFITRASIDNCGYHNTEQNLSQHSHQQLQTTDQEARSIYAYFKNHQPSKPHNICSSPRKPNLQYLLKYRNFFVLFIPLFLIKYKREEGSFFFLILFIHLFLI